MPSRSPMCCFSFADIKLRKIASIPSAGCSLRYRSIVFVGIPTTKLPTFSGNAPPDRENCISRQKSWSPFAPVSEFAIWYFIIRSCCQVRDRLQIWSGETTLFSKIFPRDHSVSYLPSSHLAEKVVFYLLPTGLTTRKLKIGQQSHCLGVRRTCCMKPTALLAMQAKRPKDRLKEPSKTY
jgi:hypothetical protein